MTGTRSHEESVLEMLRKDESFAIDYLAVALEEIDEPGGAAGFLTAVRRVAEARGGMGNLSQATGLARQTSIEPWLLMGTRDCRLC